MRPDATDALRHHLVEALERRAAGHDGEVRRVLEERIARLRSGNAVPVAADGERANRGVRVVSEGGTEEASSLPMLTKRLSDAAVTRSAGRRSTYPELPALDEFQATWSALRSEHQWRQSLVDAPANAGPLNSSALVHRAIALMRDTSPGYLQPFLAYIDDLAWLGQISDVEPRAVTGIPQPTRPGKRVRKKVPRTKA